MRRAGPPQASNSAPEGGSAAAKPQAWGEHTSSAAFLRAEPPASIAVFARAPVAGYAKTRLIPRLGREGAAVLQQCLTLRAVRAGLAAGLGPTSLWCTPDRSHPAFTAIGHEFGIRMFTQRGADLGARMSNAFDAMCRTGPALLIGTDCPALTADTLRRCARILNDGHDAVLVPAEDGGYVLVGLRRAAPVLFDAMPWGSDRVVAETRRRLEYAGLRWRELAPSWDVDRPEDFDRLAASSLMPELDAILGSG